MTFNLRALLEEMIQRDASDLHITAAERPKLRVDGDMTDSGVIEAARWSPANPTAIPETAKISGSPAAMTEPNATNSKKMPPSTERCARAGRASASAVRPATPRSPREIVLVATPMTPRIA